MESEYKYFEKCTYGNSTGVIVKGDQNRTSFRHLHSP